ncbi:MAG: PEP-CTERM system histidine kinase PrsK, partial [Gammaproteobacteria bacterium]|nr:PEP-CTERM system histidine kinase PrsK [Gammaproteobacteria bacterium]
MNIGSIGYSISAIAFFIFFTVLLTDKQKGAAKILLVIAAFSSSVWSFSMSYQAMTGSDFITPQVLEFVKSISWIALLLKMLSVTYGAGITTSSFKVALGSIIIFVVFMMLPVMYQYHNQGITTFGDSFNYLLASHLLLAVIGIVLIEQLYRNTRPEQRWVIKFLCLGLGGMYVYDFYMYSDGLLYKRIDLTLWYARGFVDALVVPLIGVAIIRDPLWSPEIFISRKVVFHTTSLLASAIYLMTMGVAGYYVRDYGGSWGLVGQAFLLSFTILSLSLLLFSKRIRARWKVLLNKHFYPYKYDYREEWLGFIKNISTIGDDTSLYQKTIKSIAQIIDSPGGMLWLRQKSGSYECIETLRMPSVKIIESSQSPLVKFLDENEFVISIDEFKESPEVYNRLGFIELPDWINEVTPWLIVPLIHIDELIGFIVLDHSVAQKKHFNWEDRDLLKTAARQAAAFIAQREVADELAEAKQFEVFTRLSAY